MGSHIIDNPEQTAHQANLIHWPQGFKWTNKELISPCPAEPGYALPLQTM